MSHCAEGFNMAFYGSSASNLTNGYGKPGESRGGYNLDNRTRPGFQSGTHASTDPEDTPEIGQSTNNGF